MGTSLTPPAPSGDAALTYSSGAGFLPAPANQTPAAFRSLAQLLLFWEITAQSVTGFSSGTPYSINGVPVHTAICVHTTHAFTEGWLLFMAPWAAHSAWYYMATYLNLIPGIESGPVVKGSKVAKYVAIKDQGNVGVSCDWLFPCSPDMKKLTRL
jgi:hypothetical protein